MRNPTEPTTKANERDDFQTPFYAVKPLLPYLNRDWDVWESACGAGYLVRALVLAGWEYAGISKSDVGMGPMYDYFEVKPGDFDLEITNPPYSRKVAWMKLAIERSPRFALLLPALFEQWNLPPIEKHNLEIIMPIQRINFVTPSGGGAGAWFKTCWFTRGLNIGRRFTICDLEPERAHFHTGQVVAFKVLALYLAEDKLENAYTATIDRRVAALEELHDERPKMRALIKRARAGYYSDFQTPIAAPKATLVNELVSLGHDDLARQVQVGAFDDSREEGEAWLREGGAAALAEVENDPTLRAILHQLARGRGLSADEILEDVKAHLAKGK